MYRAPHKCAICGEKLTITRLSCPSCETTMEGKFEGCPFCSLSPEEMRFLLIFLKNRGSIKDVEREMGISYPTVRSALDNLIDTLGLNEGDSAASTLVANEEAKLPRRRASDADTARERKEILKQLSEHKISADEAARRLREL